MRLSTKSRFAVTAMIDMGLRQHQGPVSLAAISQRQQISISYLEQIFSSMRQHGLVESTRGPGGGYTLNRDAHLISVADIIHAVNHDAPSEEMSGDPAHQGFVSTQDLWSTLHEKLDNHMRTISLASLIADQKSKVGDLPAQGSPKRGVFAKPQQKQTVMAPNSVFALGRALAQSR